MNRTEKRRRMNQYKKTMPKEQALALANKRYREDLEKEAEEKYKKIYQEQFQTSVQIYNTVLVYSLHFSKLTKFGGKRIQSFVDDFMATVEEFEKGTEGFTLKEYKEQLKADGIEY